MAKPSDKKKGRGATPKSKRCAGILPNGERCTMLTKKGKYCQHHDPRRRAERVAKAHKATKAARAKREENPPEKRELPTGILGDLGTLEGVTESYTLISGGVNAKTLKPYEAQALSGVVDKALRAHEVLRKMNEAEDAEEVEDFVIKGVDIA